jgi:GTPase SAR1 family protein
MASPKHNDYVFKVIVVGDSGCGKSCLIQRYLTN